MPRLASRHCSRPRSTSRKVAGRVRVLRLSRGRLWLALEYCFVNTAVGTPTQWQPQILPAPANPTSNLQGCIGIAVPGYENQARTPGPPATHTCRRQTQTPKPLRRGFDLFTASSEANFFWGDPAGNCGSHALLNFSIHQPLGADFLQDGGGYLFDRLGGGRQPTYAGAPHHGLGFAHFHAAIFQ